MRFGQFINFLSILAIGENLPRVWGECIGELFDITAKQLDDWRSEPPVIDAQKTFVLCPDTTYETGGDEYIYVFLPNVLIKCGENGKRSNNCIIKAGTVGFHSIFRSAPDGNLIGGSDAYRLDNIVFQGVTFEFLGDTGRPEGGGSHSAVVELAGHYRFEDCRWNDNWVRYLFIINPSFYPLDDSEEDGSITVEIIDSTIENGNAGWGLFQNYGQNLTVVNTKFDKWDIVNWIPNPSNTSFTSVFDQFGGELEIVDSCFTNIQVTEGIVVALPRTLRDDDGIVTGKEHTNGIFDNIYTEGNTITDPSSPNKACEDIRITTPDKPDFDNAECIAFEEDAVCPTDAPTSAPTPAPTKSMAPSDVPSSAPSSAPTKSMAPSDAPTKSMAPSSAPTKSLAPSDAPSKPPTTSAPEPTKTASDPTSAAPTSVPTKIKTCLTSVVAFSIVFGLGLIS